MNDLEIKIKTLTPLWTGGVDQTCDRLHETGLIGSLRWWYEALVRGLGGYACDPTSEDSESRCAFDSRAYEKAKSDGCSEQEALNRGLKTICPVCYLFGTTGWARLFQLRVKDVPTTPLHFRTSSRTNEEWLRRVFGGESSNIDSIKVPYGTITIQLTFRRPYKEYAIRQIALILRIIAGYGGIGARIQHGFGQIQFPSELNEYSFQQALGELRTKLEEGSLRSTGPKIDTPFSLQNLIVLNYQVPSKSLAVFINSGIHVGSREKTQETLYIPCVFDLRYKGKRKFGMRRWLKQQGWSESSDPKKLEELDRLLGPRSEWKHEGQTLQIDKDMRTAGRVFFSMPYKDGESYCLRVFAFWSEDISSRLPNSESLKKLCKDYMRSAFDDIEPVLEISGQEILNSDPQEETQDDA